MLTVLEAMNLIAQTIQPSAPLSVSLAESIGTVSAETLTSNEASPPFDKALMDGFAIRSQDLPTYDHLEVLERLTAGQVPQRSLNAGQTSQVMTGTQVPAGTDAVVRIEDVLHPEQEQIQFSIDEIKPGRNLLHQAECLQVGEIILAENEPITFPKLALLAELGRNQLKIRRQPRVAILATGNELVPIDELPQAGQIRNSNESMLQAQIQNSGAIAQSLGIARDEPRELIQKVEKGLQSDFLILTGGVSAGVLDLVPKTLAELGVQQIFHKVKLKPGKPIWFGIRNADQDSEHPCYVFGLPGNPVSSMVCYELFVRKALQLFQGRSGNELDSQLARLQTPNYPGGETLLQNVARGDRPVYYPAEIAQRGAEMIATPVRWLGSADLNGASTANGMILFESREGAYAAGELVPSWRWF